MAFNLAERMERGAVVSGNDAIIYIILPDGRRLVLANVIKFSSEVNYSKTSYPILGLQNKPHKKGTGEISGSMTLHYNCSIFREGMLEYKKTQKDAYYDLQVVNEDPDSGVGRQTVIFYGVNFDSLPLALVDAESEYLTEDLKFTANDWDLENVFSEDGLKQA